MQRIFNGTCDGCGPEPHDPCLRRPSRTENFPAHKWHMALFSSFCTIFLRFNLLLSVSFTTSISNSTASR
ncbi:hypothetical protein ACLOJK_025846 [Asimina triloba]